MLATATLVAADFVKTGGMDRANYALADYLARSGVEVSLVAHRVGGDLLKRPGVTLAKVPRPFGMHILGEYTLDRAGRKARDVAPGPFLVNGGNCLVRAVNWVHYVHALFQPRLALGLRVLKQVAHARVSADRERKAFASASLIVSNSLGTQRALVEQLGVPSERVRTVYYGIDASVFGPVVAEERELARQHLGLGERPTAVFVGGLGDRRKGFDTLFDAWRKLCMDAAWDAQLLVVGGGRDLRWWQDRVRSAGLANRVRFLGFRKDVPRVLAASDLVVAPTRYEAFGLGVAEGIARGLPAIVSRGAGVAELYPGELGDLLLDDPDSADELVAKLKRWRSEGCNKSSLMGFSERLRGRSWDDMASEIERLMATVG